MRMRIQRGVRGGVVHAGGQAEGVGVQQGVGGVDDGGAPEGEGGALRRGLLLLLLLRWWWWWWLSGRRLPTVRLRARGGVGRVAGVRGVVVYRRGGAGLLRRLVGRVRVLLGRVGAVQVVVVVGREGG